MKIVVLAYPRIANFDDFDPLRLEPDVDLVFVRPGEADSRRCGAGHPAGLEGDDRRSRRPAASRLGHRPAGACAARRACAGHLRRLPDARPQRRRSAGHRRPAGDGRGARPAAGRHGARRRQGAGRGRRATSPTACRSRATRCMSAARPARRAPLLDLATATTQGAISRNGRIAGCYIHGLLTDDRQRRHWLRRSARRRRASTTRPTSMRRSTCWPTTSRRTSIATGCWRWRENR